MGGPLPDDLAVERGYHGVAGELDLQVMPSTFRSRLQYSISGVELSRYTSAHTCTLGPDWVTLNECSCRSISGCALWFSVAIRMETQEKGQDVDGSHLLRL
jgi:hypothetical protein